jgi:hypothetical protein
MFIEVAWANLGYAELAMRSSRSVKARALEAGERR